MRRAFGIAAVLSLLVIACSSSDSMGINDFAEFASRFPARGERALAIPHDNTYLNYAPVGWIVDPTDNTKFLLYVNKFIYPGSNPDVDAKLTVYSGSLSDPYTLTLVGDVLTKGAGGEWDNSGIYLSGSQVLSDNGTVYVLYGGRSGNSDYYRVGLATSTDGRTFEKYAGNPVITPPLAYREAGGGYQSGILKKSGDTYYYYVTQVDATGGIHTDGQGLCRSSNMTSWVDDGVTVLAPGPESYDASVIEAGVPLQFGPDHALAYTGLGGSYWKISLAWASSPGGAYSKWTGNPAFTEESTSVACPIFGYYPNNVLVMYYQKSLDPGVGSTWDIYSVLVAEPSGIQFSGATFFGGSMP